MKVLTTSGREFNFTPAKLIGAGGEAEIYKIDAFRVAKIFKTEKHPDFQGNLDAQNAVKAKLDVYENKLKSFPKNLPSSVVSPEELLFDTKNRFAGFIMKFIDDAEVCFKLSERRYKEQLNIDANFVLDIYRTVHSGLSGIHDRGVVIGDFNDLNLMFKSDKHIYFIDVDSYQFAGYQSLVYTEKFVDPLKCNTNLQLASPHDHESDWYAFCVMITEALLCAGPYSGIHKPKTGPRMTMSERIKNRVTIFDAEVQYPKPAYKIDILPPDLTKFLKEVFTMDVRQKFPIHLLQNSLWVKCKNCGLLHGNTNCPECNTKVQVKIQVHHNIKVRQVFETSGQILNAVHQSKLRFLYHANSDLKRENSATVMRANKTDFRLKIHKDSTVIAKYDKIVIMHADKTIEKFDCQKYGNLPLVDANNSHVYYVNNDVLYRTDELGTMKIPFRIGDVIGNSTLFWVGELFGFGFYRASEIVRGFIFDAERSGINDTVKIQIKGNLIDSTCAFTENICWFFYTSQVNGQRMNFAYVIQKSGEVLEYHENPAWLPRIRGNCAIGKQLFVADDDGLHRYEIGGNTRDFIGTSDLCDIDSFLLFADNGIYVIDRQRITHLQI